MITEDMLKRAYLDDAMWHYFQRKLSAVPEAERLLRVEETLKFLFILSECDGPIPVAPEIDEVWHLWILQTREYMALCEQLPTGSYLHHCSYDYVRHSEPDT
jgi:hypothetical protein